MCIRDRFNSVTLILVASIFYICRNYTIGLAPNLIVLIIGMMFQGLSYGLFTGVITCLLYTSQEDEKDESLVICGGGFPLIIHDELRGSILVSGLVHDEDHQVIVDCLRKLKDEGTCK